MSIESLFEKPLNKNIDSNFLEQLLAKFPAHIYWKDVNGELLGCNDNNAQTFGFTSGKEIMGKTDFDLLPDNPELAEMSRQNDLRIMRTGIEETIEEKMIINGQEKIYLSQKIPMRNDKNKVIGILGVSLDITAHKEMESKLITAKNNAETDNQTKTEFLEQLITELPAHVYWKDLNGVHLGCNDNNAQTFGFTSGKEVIGKTDFDLLPNNNKLAELSRKNDLRIMRSGIKETIEEKVIVNGQEKIFLSQKAPLTNKQKDVIGILGISIDITERKQMEEQLKNAVEKAESANKAKTQFLQNMRHDFRTPFTGILGMANILYEDEANKDKKEQLNSIVTSAQVLLEQLNEITDFIAMENGEMAVLEKQFDLHKLTKDLKNMLLPAIQKKSLKFIITIDSKVPQFIIGDVLRTQRIIMNLLTNAVKFTASGHIALKINVGKEENNKIIIQFTVKDTGMGISKKEQDVIFERFSRLTPSYKGIYPGKGLGLRIVKQFVDELNGEVHLQSKPDDGTTFIVLIPYKLPLLRCDEQELLANG